VSSNKYNKDQEDPICMNRDAGSYQLSHTWDKVISRSRALSSCRPTQSTRRDQDPTDIKTLSIGNNTQLCKLRSFCLIDCTNWKNLFNNKENRLTLYLSPSV